MNSRWLAILLLMLAEQANGAEMLPFAPTVSEMALLPEYCKVRATDDSRSPEFRAWVDRVGPKFMGIHHYCAGLNYINRYQRLSNDEKRGYYLSRAVPEIDYVAKNMPMDFPLAGEIYLNRGIAHQLMGKVADATIDFTNAIERDPKQVRAYLYLTEFHMRSGSKAKALELVTTGLQQAPGNKSLRRKYLELGGKEPFPVADIPQISRPDPEKTPPDVKSEVTHSEIPATPISMGTEVKSSQKSDQGNVGESPETSDKKAEGAEIKRPAIGSPTNPYCRFCTDSITP
jgi:tetratricopeptide (TPR) repeat protein